jgi:hypothetical protein
LDCIKALDSKGSLWINADRVYRTPAGCCHPFLNQTVNGATSSSEEIEGPTILQTPRRSPTDRRRIGFDANAWPGRYSDCREEAETSCPDQRLRKYAIKYWNDFADRHVKSSPQTQGSLGRAFSRLIVFLFRRLQQIGEGGTGDLVDFQKQPPSAQPRLLASTPQTKRRNARFRALRPVEKLNLL